VPLGRFQSCLPVKVISFDMGSNSLGRPRQTPGQTGCTGADPQTECKIGRKDSLMKRIESHACENTERQQPKRNASIPSNWFIHQKTENLRTVFLDDD